MDKLDKLTKKINTFNKKRGWNPKEEDISKSIVIEASELMEHYQWDSSRKSSRSPDPKDYKEIGEEVADVFWYLISFCKAAKINLEKVVIDKLEKNEEKFPENKFKGKHNEKYYKKRKREYRARRKKK